MQDMFVCPTLKITPTYPSCQLSIKSTIEKKIIKTGKWQHTFEYSVASFWYFACKSVIIVKLLVITHSAYKLFIINTINYYYLQPCLQKLYYFRFSFRICISELLYYKFQEPKYRFRLRVGSIRPRVDPIRPTSASNAVVPPRVLGCSALVLGRSAPILGLPGAFWYSYQ